MTKARFTQKGLCKDQAKDRLKTGKDYEILGQTFSNSFKKLDFQTILEIYYLRFLIFPCLEPPLARFTQKDCKRLQPKVKKRLGNLKKIL